MSKSEMLINYVPGEECRIAIIEDARLEEFYQERAAVESHVGNIYKGKVTNIEPSIQAAFVDFGLERNGFLHISDLHPMYFGPKDREQLEKIGKKTPHTQRPLIQKCMRRGQEVLVQVLKEGIGTKGPTLTSYLSIPGRFLVMMPYMDRMGVSRKIEDDEARREMRKILQELATPENFGFIVRTAGIGQTKIELKRDLAYLIRLWKAIEQRRQKTPTVGELYAESDLVIRTIRDVFSPEIERIVIDDPTAAQRARNFLAIVNPRSRSKVFYYNAPVPLFHRFHVEAQIDSINAREVPLKSGGALVFDQTEALVAIDVNSGKSRTAKDAETNAFQTNTEAVEEIARQLRLRDLGGLIVNDLIDMRETKYRRQIEQMFRTYLKKDRARTRTGPISQFGMLEMTRQRMRPSLTRSIYNQCRHCTGAGHIKSAESVVLEVMRHLAVVMHHENVEMVELTISPDVAFQLLNRKRSQLVGLERRYGKPVMVRVGGDTVDYVEVTAYDNRKIILNQETLLSPDKIAKPADATFVELEAAKDPALETGEMPEELAPIEDTDLVSTTEDADPISTTEDADPISTVEEADPISTVEEADPLSTVSKKKSKRRRRRGGRGRGKSRQDGEEPASPPKTENDLKATKIPPPKAGDAPKGPTSVEAADPVPTPSKKSNRRRRRSGRGRDTSKQDGEELAMDPNREVEKSASKQSPVALQTTQMHRDGKSEVPNVKKSATSPGYSNKKLSIATPKTAGDPA